MHRPKNALLIAALLFLSVLLLCTAPLIRAQQAGVIGSDAANANMRTGPGRTYAVLASLSAGTTITVEAHNEESTWLLGTAANGKRGWLTAKQVHFSTPVDLSSLPV